MEQKILKKNDEIVLEIERLGANGEGIGVYAGKIVFVPFACKGESVLAHIILDKKSFYIAKIVKVLKESPDRVSAPCPYFGKCGGCDIQHISYNCQLELKREIVRSALSKYAKIETEIQDVVGSENQLRYRNKFSFPVQQIGSEIKIGMYKKNSHSVTKIDDCLLQSEKTKTIISIFKTFMEKQNLTGYDEETKTGLIKHIVVRENENSFILTVVVTDEKFNDFDVLINLLKAKFTSFGIVKNVNKLGNNVIFGESDYAVYGLKELELNDFGITYSVNNRSFSQVNDEIKNKIYERVLSRIDESETVINAYSGAGLLSAILAKNCKQVYGIEIIKEAHQNAEKLKIKNKIYNLTNICADCAKELPKLTAKLKNDFTLIIDPPRKGVDKLVLESILASQPKKLLYISCNPATLARDIEVLKQKYDIVLAQPYDMFPQTANVETLVSLKLKEI